MNLLDDAIRRGKAAEAINAFMLEDYHRTRERDVMAILDTKSPALTPNYRYRIKMLVATFSVETREITLKMETYEPIGLMVDVDDVTTTTEETLEYLFALPQGSDIRVLPTFHEASVASVDPDVFKEHQKLFLADMADWEQRLLKNPDQYPNLSLDYVKGLLNHELIKLKADFNKGWHEDPFETACTNLKALPRAIRDMELRISFVPDFTEEKRHSHYRELVDFRPADHRKYRKHMLVNCVRAAAVMIKQAKDPALGRIVGEITEKNGHVMGEHFGLAITGEFEDRGSRVHSQDPPVFLQKVIDLISSMHGNFGKYMTGAYLCNPRPDGQVNDPELREMLCTRSGRLTINRVVLAVFNTSLRCLHMDEIDGTYIPRDWWDKMRAEIAA